MRAAAGGARPPSGQRGLAAVEMAIVIPVFLMLLLATAEIGRACYQYNALLKAARTGARYVTQDARNGAGTIDLDDRKIARARRLVVFGNPSGKGRAVVENLKVGNVAVTVVDADHVAVVVTYPYVPLLATVPTFGRGRDGLAIGTLVAASTMEAM